MKNLDTKCCWLENLYEYPGVTPKFVSNWHNVTCISSLITRLRFIEYLEACDLLITVDMIFLSDCTFPLESIQVEN